MYGNTFRASWSAGVDDCGGNGNLGEEWCADFAAWVWKEAGAAVTYQLAPVSTGDNTAPDVVNGDGDRTGYSMVEVANSRATPT
jgi:hypothetical protein